MKKASPSPNEKEPKCLASLDFKILSEMLGKDEAINIMLMADAFRKEPSMDSEFDRHSRSQFRPPPPSRSKIIGLIQPVHCSTKQDPTVDITVPIVAVKDD